MHEMFNFDFINNLHVFIQIYISIIFIWNLSPMYKFTRHRNMHIFLLKDYALESIVSY